MQFMVACIKAASFVNFCMFLSYGHYAFIVERLLGVRAVYPSQHLLRQVWHNYVLLTKTKTSINEKTKFSFPISSCITKTVMKMIIK